VPDTLAAARAAVALATGVETVAVEASPADETPQARTEWVEGQADIRGLFCGGTVCDEVFHAIKAVHPDRTRSNVAKDDRFRLNGAREGHLLVDLGADEYTQGRPHPMIDPTLRNAEIVKAAADPATAVLVIDVELGYGSHEDPAGAVAPALAEARLIAEEAGRPLELIAYVLGTDRDPQNKNAQVAVLQDLGVRVVDSAVELGAAALSTIR
jgi:hypothetical protein